MIVYKNIKLIRTKTESYTKNYCRLKLKLVKSKLNQKRVLVNV